MIQTLEGVFRNGKVELLDQPENVMEARVIVTFLPDRNGLEATPIYTPEEVAELRGKLAAWEEDWNAPGMEAYDDYETLEPWESAFIPAADGDTRITAGRHGVEIVCLHMPQTAGEYLSR